MTCSRVGKVKGRVQGCIVITGNTSWDRCRPYFDYASYIILYAKQFLKKLKRFQRNALAKRLLLEHGDRSSSSGKLLSPLYIGITTSVKSSQKQGRVLDNSYRLESKVID